MRAFLVTLPSGARYWTVVDDELAVVPDADAHLGHLRFSRDASELTTKSYAGGHRTVPPLVHAHRPFVAGRRGTPGLFMTWLAHSGQLPGGAVAGSGGVAGEALIGPGRSPVSSARRIKVALTAVRGFVAHAVTSGQTPVDLMPVVCEPADDRSLPETARREDSRMGWRLRARNRLHEPESAVNRASDEDIVVPLGYSDQLGTGSSCC